MSIHKMSLLLFVSLFITAQSAFAHHPGYTPTGGGVVEDGENISSVSMLNSPTATTLGKNNFASGFVFDFVNYDQIPAREAHELHEDGREIHGLKHSEFYNMHAGFGVLEDLDLFLIAPIVSRSTNQVEDEDAIGRDERSTGFGDMRLVGKYRFWKKGVEAAVIAGVKFPTGKSSDKDKSGAKFDPEVQPGSGSWDGEFGIALSRSFRNRFSASTSFEYILRTEGGQGFDGGDIFRYSIAASASLRPYGQYPNANLHVELNNEWARRDHERGIKTFDSGGTTVSVTPGMSFVLNEHVSAFWAMPVPIYQNLGGEHEEVEYQILTGINIVV